MNNWNSEVQLNLFKLVNKKRMFLESSNDLVTERQK